jgi:hypothetical protein
LCENKHPSTDALSFEIELELARYLLAFSFTEISTTEISASKHGFSEKNARNLTATYIKNCAFAKKVNSSP